MEHDEGSSNYKQNLISHTSFMKNAPKAFLTLEHVASFTALADGDHSPEVFGHVLHPELGRILSETGVHRPDVSHDLSAVLASKQTGAACGEDHIADVRQLILIPFQSAQDHPGRVRHAPCCER